VHGHPVSEKAFTFDYVYGQNSAQYELYDDCVAPLVSKFVEGFNATVLAYGQTGSGKTYSMGTALDSTGDAEGCTSGIVQRAVRSIFDYLHSKSEKNPAGFQYSIAVSFLELYNEELVDLLNPRRSSPGGWGGLSIRENSEGAIVWSGVREENVRNADEILRCLQKGTLCRTTASTEMNTTSSRSHAIFSVILRQQKWQPRPHENDDPNELLEGLEGDLDFVITENPYANPITHPDGQWVHLTSKFHFVDLAGSERLKKTNAAGDRKKEGISINQGLLALGNVISVLGDESKRGMHVPYRDSKLTRMLQDSLGGNSQTLMLACVSPSDFNYGETMSTLNYANRARNIRNRVLINQ
ncbi:P-loop containing nucleoside triphosphate hydrolase protein, partial [Cladochytrium replicatum]